MPFELGLDFGCKRYKGGAHGQKVCLILDSESYRYKKALSDLSGNDIAAHDNSPEKAVAQVRNWLQKHRPPGAGNLASPTKIWTLYNEFLGNLRTLISDSDIDEMPKNEFFSYISEFLSDKTAS